MNDLTVAANELKRLRDIGVRLAIDDFGTGYTSLAHLHYLPLDFVKIDRTFISHIQTSGDASLVRMITDLAKQLGLTTVSEGVETPEQLDILKELGSDRIQGYLVARPMPADQVRGWAGDHLSRAGRPLAERTSG
jgi:EAL domain-containing protein (putative c-di-GMP-specific phosphodiesterase class I)